MRNSFLLGGILMVPFSSSSWACSGCTDGDSSLALFSMAMLNIPLWVAVDLIPLGISLMMCNAGTAISAISNIVAVDISRAMQRSSSISLMRLPRWLVCRLRFPS